MGPDLKTVSIMKYFIFACFAFLLWFSGAYADWLPDERLSYDPRESSTQSIRPITTFENTTHVLWQEYDTFLYRRYVHNTGWDSTVTLPTPPYSLGFSICSDLQGNLHVVWQSADTLGFSKIYYKKYDNANQVWEDDTVIVEESYPVGPQTSIASDSIGNVHVVYKEYLGNIFYKKYDAQSQSWQEKVQLSTSGGADFPDVATDKDENVHVVWNALSGGLDIFYRKYLAKPQVWGPIERLTYQGKPFILSSIAIDQERNVHVVWEGCIDWVTPHQIWYKKYDGTIGIWHPETTLTSSDRWEADPFIATDMKGNLHIVWDSSFEFGVYYKRYVVDSAMWEPEYRLTYDDSIATFSAIAADSGGNLHVIWTDYRDGNPEVYYKRYEVEACISESNLVTEIPHKFNLKASPIPFSQEVVIKFHLSEPKWVTLQIYDIGGRLVRTLMDDIQDSGFHSIIWNGKDKMWRALPAGIYFYRINTQDSSITQKLTRLR